MLLLGASVAPLEVEVEVEGSAAEVEVEEAASGAGAAGSSSASAARAFDVASGPLKDLTIWTTGWKGRSAQSLLSGKAT